jgi:hypothetical protein
LDNHCIKFLKENSVFKHFAENGTELANQVKQTWTAHFSSFIMFHKDQGMKTHFHIYINLRSQAYRLSILQVTCNGFVKTYSMMVKERKKKHKFQIRKHQVASTVFNLQ